MGFPPYKDCSLRQLRYLIRYGDKESRAKAKEELDRRFTASLQAKQAQGDGAQ